MLVYPAIPMGMWFAMLMDSCWEHVITRYRYWFPNQDERFLMLIVFYCWKK